MNERKRNAREIFERAIEFDDPIEREAYIANCCTGNFALQKEVDFLIRAHLDATGILNSQPAINDLLKNPAEVSPSSISNSNLELAGEEIGGKYRLIEIIGEGGMGAVWMAEQQHPIKRKVAIKMIKAGMDTSQVLRRFESERQTLALMDHPNIARVIDGGMTNQGRPYFVMEYVKGVPITEYCDNARLTVDERLKLFLPLCKAVQHAHQRGIIHRDIKPSNVLVCLYDGAPVPKVIDFGLAKALDEGLSDRSVFTSHGALIGTPLYMSPEQAELNNIDVDTRTDVYSLGVVLYEILVGSTPLEKSALKEAALNEVIRIIKEVDPPIPSTRISSSYTRDSIAFVRSIDANQLRKSLAGDLDWIVMKAIEKQRSRRYESPLDFARDIERFLEDQPVNAGPPSLNYRTSKFIKRNRVAITVAGLLGLVIFGGIAGTLIGMGRALKASREQQAALESMRLANDGFKNYFNLVQETFAAISPEEASDDISLRDKLAKGLLTTARQIQDTIPPGVDRSRMLARLAGTLVAFGHPEESLKLAQQARSGLRDAEADQYTRCLVAWILSDCLYANDDKEGAARLLSEIIEDPNRFQSLAPEEQLKVFHDLAFVTCELGRVDEAIATWRKEIEFAHELKRLSAISSSCLNKTQATTKHEILRNSPLTSENMEKLELNLKTLEELYGPESHTVSAALANVAQNYSYLAVPGSLKKSFEYSERAFSISERRFGKNSTTTAERGAVLVLCAGRQRMNKEGKSRLAEALKRVQPVIDSFDTRTPDNFELSMALHGNIASAHGLMGNSNECIEAFKRIVDLSEKRFGRASSRAQEKILHLYAAQKQFGNYREAIELLNEHISYLEGTGADKDKYEASKLKLELQYLKVLSPFGAARKSITDEK